MESLPAGLGWWIAFERALSPGGKADDLALAIERCRQTGASWVALRMGVDGANDEEEGLAHGAESIKAFADAGLDVLVWFYIRHRTATKRVVADVGAMLALGARGVIIDGEFDYDGGPEDARDLVAGLRRAGAAFVAHAPPDYLGAGLIGKVPDYLAALDAICDAIMPQVYAWEHDDRGHAYHLDRVCAAYQKRGIGPDRLWPIGAAYRPKMRGGRPAPAMDGEAARVGADAVAFLDHPAVRACPAPSLYSLDAVSWINGAADQVITQLAARARSTSTLPAPPLVDGVPTRPDSPRSLRPPEPGLELGDGGPTTPLGWQDRAERDAEDAS